MGACVCVCVYTWIIVFTWHFLVGVYSASNGHAACPRSYTRSGTQQSHGRGATLQCPVMAELTLPCEGTRSLPGGRCSPRPRGQTAPSPCAGPRSACTGSWRWRTRWAGRRRCPRPHASALECHKNTQHQGHYDSTPLDASLSLASVDIS